MCQCLTWQALSAMIADAPQCVPAPARRPLAQLAAPHTHTHRCCALPSCSCACLLPLLQVVLDLSRAASLTDMRPLRAAVMSGILQVGPCAQAGSRVRIQRHPSATVLLEPA